MVLGCADDGRSPGEGFIQVDGGRVWYRINGSGSATPLLLLHGGPGAPSYYLDPLAALADERPVIFYDQLGAGRSDQPSDTLLWTVDRFVRELAAVRTALGLERVHILGHSWGTMLAMDYMLTRPEGVASLILASPALSIPRWLHDADSLLRTLPDSVQQVVRTHEEAGTTDSPEYMSAVMEFYGRYVWRANPPPPEIDSVFTHFGAEVYGYMWGPSEFTGTGTLRDYDRTDRLGELTVPVLFTAGRYDEAVPSTVAWYQSLVPGARLVILENSAHMTMLDEPERYVEVIREWLSEVESRR
ncbi:MAG: proline iminopeptidase-family hydrolase [Gemmatimonadetes bacterium]|nr:proline iminopeptidase-family hydrolase [Gemmatimonadota bacterium]